MNFYMNYMLIKVKVIFLIIIIKILYKFIIFLKEIIYYLKKKIKNFLIE